MKQPLINRDTPEAIEFSINHKKHTSALSVSNQAERKMNKYLSDELEKMQLTTIAKLQIFDLAASYEQLIEKYKIPKQLYPQDFQNLQNSKKSAFEDYFKWLPLFHPYNIWTLAWQSFICIIIVFYLIYIPLKVFFYNPQGKQFDEFDTIKWFVELTLIPLFLDILVNFNIAIYQNGVLVTSRKAIALNYLRWDCEIDFVANVSLVIALITDNDWIRYLYFIKINSLMRIDDKIMHSLQLWLRIKAIYQIVKLFLILLFVTHTFACFFYAVGVSVIRSYPDDQQLEAPSWLNYSSYSYNGDPIQQDYDELWELYGISLYWALTTISTVGYGDITPKNAYETLIAMSTMLIAGMVFAFNVASIRETMIEMNQKQSQFNSQIIYVNRYMYDKGISEETQMKVNEYLAYLFQEEKNRDRDVESQLFDSLPPDLKEQLYAEASKQFLNSNAFNQQNYTTDFLKQLATGIEEIHYGAGETLFTQYQLEDDPRLYYIIKGKVILYHKIEKRRFNNQINLALLSDNETFNEMQFMTGKIPLCCAKTLTYTSFFCIRRSVFLSKLRNFQVDFEKYHLIMSRAEYEEFYRKIGLRCYTCGKYTHACFECPVTHYVPYRSLLLASVQVEELDKVRTSFERRARSKFKFAPRQNLKEAKQYAQQLMQENDYFDQISKRLSFRRNTNIQNSRMSLGQQPSEDELYQSNLNSNVFATQLIHIEEQTNEKDLVLEEVQEIKVLIQHICKQLNIQLPKNEKQEQQDEYMIQHRPFIPQKPIYYVNEISFDIDEIKNYEYFYPEFNFDQIIISYERNTASIRSINRQQSRKYTRR